MDIEEGESLFKFEKKDNPKNPGFSQQGANPFGRSDKIEGVFAETLDKDNLGYLNSLIKNREMTDQMATKRDRRGYNKSKSLAKEDIDQLQPAEDMTKEGPTVQKELFKQTLTPNEKPEHSLFSNKINKSADEEFLIQNRDSVQQINPKPSETNYLTSQVENQPYSYTNQANMPAEQNEIISPYSKNKQILTNAPDIGKTEGMIEPNGSFIEDQVAESTALEFVNSVSEFLNYFDSAEQETGDKTYSDYFQENSETVEQLKQLLDQKQNEVYTLRGKLERMEMKLNEANNMNSVLVHELSKLKNESSKNVNCDTSQT